MFPALLAAKGLWLLAAAVPLIALYVLKTRRKTVKVSSAAMYDLARREAKARVPWKRLTPETSLLLQLLALILLALAFSRPVSKGATYDADAVVVVIDRSASMAARVRPIASDPSNASPTRMTRAKEEAAKLLDRLGIGAEVAVVVAGRDARVVATLQRGAKAAKASLAGIEAGLLEGDVEPALDVARDLLRGRTGKRRVVLFTDGSFARPPTWLAEEGGAELDVVPIEAGPREGNVGIVRVDVRRGPSSQGPDHVDVAVTLAAFGTPEEGRTRWVTLRRMDRPEPLDARKVEIPAGEPGHGAVTLGFSPAADGSDELATLAIELAPGDALALDDKVQLVVPPPRRMPVTLASLGVGGSTWLARALVADPDVKLDKVHTAALAQATVEAWSLVVTVDTCPTTAPGGGDLLIVNPPPGNCWGRTVGAAVSGADLPAITSWSPSDPRLRYVELEGVKLGRVVPIAPLGADATKGAALLGAAALVRAEQLAVIADASTLDRTVTLWGFDPADGDLARRAAFVLLARDAVDMARTRRDRSWAPSARAGVAARITAAAGAKEVVARRVGAPVTEIAARAPVLEGVALLEGLDQMGPYVLEGSATPAPLTVALLAEQESDVVRNDPPVSRRVGAPGGGVAAGKNPVEIARARADLRWLVALFAAVVLAGDALWLTRRGARAVARLARRKA